MLKNIMLDAKICEDFAKISQSCCIATSAAVTIAEVRRARLNPTVPTHLPGAPRARC